MFERISHLHARHILRDEAVSSTEVGGGYLAGDYAVTGMGSYIR